AFKGAQRYARGCVASCLVHGFSPDLFNPEGNDGHLLYQRQPMLYRELAYGLFMRCLYIKQHHVWLIVASCESNTVYKSLPRELQRPDKSGAESDGNQEDQCLVTGSVKIRECLTPHIGE